MLTAYSFLNLFQFFFFFKKKAPSSQLQALLQLTQVTQAVKNRPAVRETQGQSLSREIPWGGEWRPTPVFLPGKS